MMWYDGGSNEATTWQIGLATSTNGIDHWIKHPSNPVLSGGAFGTGAYLRSGRYLRRSIGRLRDVAHDKH